MRAAARIGCSGWSYRDWRGVVYPDQLPQSRWFEHYATLFDTVELNNTFYRLPTSAAVERWAAAAPKGFVYATKLGMFGSHRKKLREPEPWLANHLDRVERLGSALGPNLVQLPPRWHRNTARLDEFLEAAPASIRWAVEFREPTWLHDDVFVVLQRHGAALCIHDLIKDHPFTLTTDWTYIRFHGPDALVRPYHGAYGPGRLRRWADRIDEVLEDGHDVYGYFNNDFDGNAVRDAQWLLSALTRHESFTAPGATPDADKKEGHCSERHPRLVGES